MYLSVWEAGKVVAYLQTSSYNEAVEEAHRLWKRRDMKVLVFVIRTDGHMIVQYFPISG